MATVILLASSERRTLRRRLASIGANALLAASATAFLVASAAPLRAQCHVFDPRFAVPGVTGSVHAFAIFDDGRGPALYAGGDLQTAGGVVANGVARWDGSHWEPLGAGIPGGILALASHDDGSGPALYAAGTFQSAGGSPALRIARWNGTTWSQVGAGFNSPAVCLAVYDDGNGPKLYAGSPLMSGTTPLDGLAKWNGISWERVGGGVGSSVLAMTVWNPGTGPRLYIGGDFQTVGPGLPAMRVASWNGVSWAVVGQGFDQDVRALAVHGNQLYAGGAFMHTGLTQVRHVAVWNGAAWSGVGGGFDANLNALASVDAGNGPQLFAGGFFDNAGTQAASRIAAWDGSAWTALGNGTDEGVMALQGFDAGSGTRLFAGGFFQTADALGCANIASWRNGWSAASDTAGLGPHGQVEAVATIDLGNGPKLYAAGAFSLCGSVPATRIAAFDGSSWSALGMGLGNTAGDHVDAIAAYDDGGGPELYAAGDFHDVTLTYPNYIGRWDGTNWNTVGLGITYYVLCLAVHDDGSGSSLFAGGYFTVADQAPALRIAKWNGLTWQPLGGGMDAAVRSLAVFDDGTGPSLYAVGSFDLADGNPTSGIARWDGVTFWPVGGGLGQSGGSVLIVHDDGTGPALYAGGGFTEAGGNPANHVARWNGTAWSQVGAGLPRSIGCFTAFDDGTGMKLYAGDGTSQAGQVAQIWRWDGATWSTFSSGFAGSPGGGGSVRVKSMAVFDDGAGGGPDLYVAGSFHAAAGVVASELAEWHGCSEPFTAYCFGDGSGTACPCGNAGSPGNGCASNSQSAGGNLAASGVASIAADTLVLTATTVTNGSGLYIQGTLRVNGGLGNTFGDGLRCVGGLVVRLGIIPGAGNSSHYPRAGIDQPISIRGMNVAGNVRNYQLWYREIATFCTSATFNLTNALNLTWLP